MNSILSFSAAFVFCIFALFACKPPHAAVKDGSETKNNMLTKDETAELNKKDYSLDFKIGQMVINDRKTLDSTDQLIYPPAESLVRGLCVL